MSETIREHMAEEWHSRTLYGKLVYPLYVLNEGLFLLLLLLVSGTAVGIQRLMHMEIPTPEVYKDE